MVYGHGFLNFLCSQGYKTISWILVILPFIIFILMILFVIEIMKINNIEKFSNSTCQSKCDEYYKKMQKKIIVLIVDDEYRACLNDC